MKKHILLFCILTVFIQNVQLAGQDFSDYKFCSRIAIDDADTYLNKASGIAFNPTDNTFLITLSSPEVLYVVDMDGTLLSTNPLVGFADVEGLEIIDENTFALVEEYNRGNIVFLPLPIPINQSIHYPDPTQTIHCPDYISGNDFESVAYDADGDVLYWATENGRVFSLAEPRSYASTNNTLEDPAFVRVNTQKAISDFTGYTTCSSIDRNAHPALYEFCKDIQYFNIGGMHFSSSNTLWLVGDRANDTEDIMMELDPHTGDVLNIFELDDPKMPKLQGITEGPSGEMIVIDHWSLYMTKFDDDCVVYNDCPADESVFFDFEQGMDLCNLEEVNYSHWRRQQQEWIEYDVTKIEGATNGDYYFLLEEGDPEEGTSPENGGSAEGPEIDLAGIPDPVVKFDYALDNFTLKLYISEDDGSTWEIVWEETAPYSDATIFPLEWNQSIIRLDNYTNQKIKFRFEAIKGINDLTEPTLHAISALDAIEFGSVDGLISNNDADNDGLHALYDCNDNNPDLPGEPGFSCDDGNPNTTEDYIQIDGCTCAGYYPCAPFYELSGVINSAIFPVQDYIHADGQIATGNTVMFIAGNNVDLLPGFDAKGDMGTDFLAFTQEICPANKQETDDEQIAIRNYPNPFTEQTTIEFTLSKDEPVTLFVSDATGRRVAVLLNHETKTQGTHLTTFDSGNYPSGMYYYTIQAGEYIGTQKMVLVK